MGIAYMASVLAASALSASGTATAPAYHLAWSDEFEVDGQPDPTKWTFESGFVRNDEAQWYQPQNAIVEDGRLVIEGRRESRANPFSGLAAAPPVARSRKIIRFTSASVTTRQLHSWKYGRFEIRARIPAGQGMWPALWFVGDEGHWPACGEIDLMEYYQDQILGNFAWASAVPGQPVWRSRKIKLSDFTSDPQWASQFHVWAMDWDEHQISLVLDGQVVNRLDLDTVRNGDGTNPGNPFRRPHYLIINLAMGGTRGGALADASLPARFEIDYVRVYQRRSGK